MFANIWNYFWDINKKILIFSKWFPSILLVKNSPFIKSWITNLFIIFFSLINAIQYYFNLVVNIFYLYFILNNWSTNIDIERLSLEKLFQKVKNSSYTNENNKQQYTFVYLKYFLKNIDRLFVTSLNSGCIFVLYLLVCLKIFIRDHDFFFFFCIDQSLLLNNLII